LQPRYPMNPKSLLATGAALLVCVCCVNAQDWPQWRGMDRDGRATTFKTPEKWPDQLVRKWKTPVGKGDTSPALVGKRLFTFGRVGTNEWVQCLDVSSGKMLWDQTYAEPYVVEGPSVGHPGPRSSVCASRKRVFTMGIAGVLSCLDLKTGKLLWRKQSMDDYDGTPYRSDTSISPLLTDDLCIVHVGADGKGAVLAFEEATGKIRWKTDLIPSISSSPVVAVFGGKRQVVSISVDSLFGLDLKDGKMLWHSKFQANRGNCTTPVIEGDRVLVTGEQRGLICFKVDSANGSFRATPIWTNMALVSRMTTPIVRNGLVFGFGTHFFCGEVETGKTLWIAKEGVPSGYYGCLVDCGKEILGQTLKGDLVFFGPSKSQYGELARYKVTDTELWALPVVSGKRIFTRDADSVSLWTFEQ